MAFRAEVCASVSAGDDTLANIVMIATSVQRAMGCERNGPQARDARRGLAGLRV